MKRNIFLASLLLAGCTVTFPVIPLTNYIPVHSELSQSKCNNKVGISQVKFEDIREQNNRSSPQTYIYAEDGFIDSIKRAGLYSEKSPISVTIKLRKLDWPAEIYESDIEYIVSNKSTKQTSKFTFKGNCSIEGDNASIGHSSDVLGCTIRKNYAKFINHISMPSKENLVCK